MIMFIFLSSNIYKYNLIFTNVLIEIEKQRIKMGRKYILVPQKFSAPYPKKVQMTCQCGRTFTTSVSLTDHLQKVHMPYLKDKKMKKKQKGTQKIINIDENEHEQRAEASQDHQQSKKKNKIIKKGDVPKHLKIKKKMKNLEGDDWSEKESDRFQISISENTEQINALSRQLTSKLTVQPVIEVPSIAEISQISSEPTQNNTTSTSTTDREQKYKKYKQFTVETAQQIKPYAHPLTVLSPGEFYAKKIYQCGQCKTLYNCSEQLKIHVSLYHKGDFPLATIWGPKKLELYEILRIPYSKYEGGPNPEKLIKYRCGCGKLYSAGPALAIHIKNKHDSIPPTGTVGLTSNSCAKRVVEEYGMKGYVPYDQ